MRYLGLREVLELHRRITDRTGGAAGVRDLGLVMSALAQPLMTFGGEELYPDAVEKASALAFLSSTITRSLTGTNVWATPHSKPSSC